MKKNCFFVDFYKNLSKTRKINLAFAMVISITLAIVIPSAWWDLGSPASCCLVGSLFGLIFPMAIWMQVDDMLKLKK